MGGDGLEGAWALLDEYRQTLRIERSASEHTIRAYANDLEDFLRWAQRSGIDPLNTGYRQLRLYLAELDQAQYSRATVNRRLSALRGFYRWLTITGIIETDPVSILQGPKRPKSLPHTIKPADMAALLRVYGGHGRRQAAGAKGHDGEEQTPSDMRNQAILEFLYACGARISEASGLKMRDVDFDRKQVKVFGKGSKERIIPIHDLAVASMARYGHFGRPKLLKGRQCEHFFVSTRGNQMGTDAMRKMFKEALKQAGLDETLSPHDMRHTFATDLLDGGADLRSVQEMLGHASLSTTQIYTHLSADRLKSVHGRLHPRGNG